MNTFSRYSWIRDLERFLEATNAGNTDTTLPMPQQRRPIQFTGDIEDEDVHLDYDPEHVLDSDPDLLRISRRLQDLSNGGALKTRHVRRMLELIKANPQLGPDRALMMAMSEG